MIRGARTTRRGPCARDKMEPLAQWAGAGGQQGRGTGPAASGAGGPGQSGAPDNGQELVDLIQRVIAPSSWEVNGGPGSIYYWRPFQALVIRQTGEVHEQIGGTLEQLQKAEH